MNTKKKTLKKVEAPKKKAVKKPVKTLAIMKGTKKAEKKASVIIVKKTARKAAVKKTKTVAASKFSHKEEKCCLNREPAIKRFFYMTLAIIIGLLLGIAVNLFVELAYLQQKMIDGEAVRVYTLFGMNSYLPIVSQIFFLLSGLIFGVWLGMWGWRMVYIERRHRMFKHCCK